MSFVVEGNSALYADDIIEVLGPTRREEASEAFDALDNDGNGDISLDEMIMKIVEVGRDRKAISSSMRDVGQAIGVLDQVIITVLFVIVVFIFGMPLIFILNHNLYYTVFESDGSPSKKSAAVPLELDYEKPLSRHVGH
jgi:hypothetical protein